MIVAGERYRLLKPIPTVGGLIPGATFPTGTEFVCVEPTIDHLDWFASLIDVDGQIYRVAWGITNDDWTEPVEIQP